MKIGFIGWLWFDVEKRYNTTEIYDKLFPTELWFDVEKRYNTTSNQQTRQVASCGLM